MELIESQMFKIYQNIPYFCVLLYRMVEGLMYFAVFNVFYKYMLILYKSHMLRYFTTSTKRLSILGMFKIDFRYFQIQITKV